VSGQHSNFSFLEKTNEQTKSPCLGNTSTFSWSFYFFLLVLLLLLLFTLFLLEVLLLLVLSIIFCGYLSEGEAIVQSRS
jgi:glucan phosphoethanolaminetransferase (alkaline phosphatase superfamily)